MPNKFSIGDKVVIKRHNRHTAKYLSESLRLDHHRTIVAIFYDKIKRKYTWHTPTPEQATESKNSEVI